jgi:hypothetical protein
MGAVGPPTLASQLGNHKQMQGSSRTLQFFLL